MMFLKAVSLQRIVLKFMIRDNVSICFVVGQYLFPERLLSGQFWCFSLLSEQSRKNRSQWFSNVAQVNLFNLCINPSAELVELSIELKIHNIQMIANYFNGSYSLCFRKSFVIF